MSSIIFVVLEVFAAVAAVVLGRRFARGFSAKGYSLNTSLRLKDSLSLLAIVMGVVGWIACFLILRAYPGIMWYLPERVELEYQRVFELGFSFAVLFLMSAVTFVAWRNRTRQSLRVVVLALTAVGCVFVFQWNRQRPIAASLGHQVSDGVILQTSGSSCAAAATANVLNSLGAETTEKEMAELLKTTTLGTPASQIAVTARAMGFGAERIWVSETEWFGTPIPCVIFVDYPSLGPESHAVSLMGISDDGIFEVWDSLCGRKLMSAAELAKTWHGRGIAIWAEDGR